MESHAGGSLSPREMPDLRRPKSCRGLVVALTVKESASCELECAASLTQLFPLPLGHLERVQAFEHWMRCNHDGGYYAVISTRLRL